VLRDLSGERIAAWAAGLRERGGKGGRGLSERTVAYASTVPAMALSDAVESGKLAASPMGEIPKRRRPTRHRRREQLGCVWTGEQARAFLDSPVVRADRYFPLWCLLLDTSAGGRRGGLRRDGQPGRRRSRTGRGAADRGKHKAFQTALGVKPTRTSTQPRSRRSSTPSPRN
jgi:hypothetical protein